jgi:uncharacterized protein YdgA (DUF945 family)
LGRVGYLFLCHLSSSRRPNDVSFYEEVTQEHIPTATLQKVNLVPAIASIISSDVSLDKAGHMDKPIVGVGGTSQSVDAVGRMHWEPLIIIKKNLPHPLWKTVKGS